MPESARVVDVSTARDQVGPSLIFLIAMSSTLHCHRYKIQNHGYHHHNDNHHFCHKHHLSQAVEEELEREAMARIHSYTDLFLRQVIY